MAVVDGHGLPIGITVHSATPHEVRLAEKPIEEIPGKKKPEKLIGDSAYLSRPLARKLFHEYEIELIAPPKKNTVNYWIDRRKLRRYRRRWKVERLFAWLNNFRRLPIRWERSKSNYYGFVLLACALILLRAL